MIFQQSFELSKLEAIFKHIFFFFCYRWLNMATLLDLENGKNGPNHASCGHPLNWSQGLNTQARPPGHGEHTWRGCPFVQHDKEVGWRIQTWQGEPGRQPPSRKTAQCPLLFIFLFSRSRRLEMFNVLCLIICNWKTRNGYSFKFKYIHQLSKSAHMPNYNCIEHRLQS